MAVFILGAGATRGCSFAEPAKRVCLPPLDADFFTQLQRVSNPKHQDLARQVVQDTFDLFGPNFTATLESVYTTLEHTARMLTVTGDNRVYKRKEFVRRRNDLKQAIGLLLEESLTDRGTGGKFTRVPLPCDYHERLVRDVLDPGDSLISFNYDCVIDYALRSQGQGKWNPHFGYGFKLGSGGRRLTGDQHWQPPGPPTARAKTVNLYKLHGSLHYQFDEDDAKSPVNLKQRPYTKQHGNLVFTIIPPAWHKSYDRGVFADLWKGAADAISHARSMVFIGYSLPETDLHSTALFRTTVTALDSLVIVNPDAAARRRTRMVLQRGIKKGTKVLSFNYLPEFLTCPRKTWMAF